MRSGACNERLGGYIALISAGWSPPVTADEADDSYWAPWRR